MTRNTTHPPGTVPTTRNTIAGVGMKAQDLESPYEEDASLVCPATQFFEDAYNAMIFNSSNDMQGNENNDDGVPLPAEPLSADEPVNEVGPPGTNYHVVDLQNEAVEQQQANAGLPRTSTEDTAAGESPVFLSESSCMPRELTDIPEYREDPTAQVPSMPSTRRCVSDCKKKGEVRFLPIGMDYRENAGEKWMPAVYHYQLREQYILSSMPSGEGYDFPDPRGRDIFDITSYHADYKDWGPSWPNRPRILQRFARDGYSVSYYDPGILIDRGRVVIDQENHPVKGFRELPLCISSKVPGYKLEAWRRLNPNITIPDFMARMPKTDKPHLTDRNKLSMRMTRFRIRAACISWIEREGCLAIKEYMSKLIGPVCVAANSTAGFGRDLTDAEVAEVVAINKGQHPERRRWRTKVEDKGQQTGSKQHPVVLGSEEEGEEEVSIREGDGYNQAPVKQETAMAAPSTHSDAHLTEASQINGSLSETMPQHQGLGDRSRRMSAMLQRSARPTPRNFVGPPTSEIPQVSRLCEYRRYGAAAANIFRNDPRYLAPRNEAEAASIQQALRFTRDDFILHYSEEAPLTDNRQCYASQWQDLRIAFWNRWCFPGEPPRLSTIIDWGNTVMEWRPPGRNSGQRNLFG